MKRIYIEHETRKGAEPSRVVFQKMGTNKENMIMLDIENMLFNEETIKEFASLEPNKAFMSLLRSYVDIYYRRYLESVPDYYTDYALSTIFLTEKNASILAKYLAHFVNNKQEFMVKIEEVERKVKETKSVFDPTIKNRGSRRDGLN